MYVMQKTCKKHLLTSVRAWAAPKRWSKYTTPNSHYISSGTCCTACKHFNKKIKNVLKILWLLIFIITLKVNKKPWSFWSQWICSYTGHGRNRDEQLNYCTVKLEQKQRLDSQFLTFSFSQKQKFTKVLIRQFLNPGSSSTSTAVFEALISSKMIDFSWIPYPQ